MKRTKIVATIGPASRDKDVLRQLIQSGVNVARLNFSHGTHEEHAEVIATIRELMAELKVAIAILGDLQGPRIRTIVAEPLTADKGDTIVVSDISYHTPGDFQADGDKTLLLDVPQIINDIASGDSILIEDGRIKLMVEEQAGDRLVTKVVDGGLIQKHKGVNIPDSDLHLPALTEKDERDLQFLLEQNVDYIALSFVGSADDVHHLRGRMQEITGTEEGLPKILVKIERKEAIKNLDEIIEATNAVMVARGDLGIEEEGARVTVLQKLIVKKSIEALKPVIVATHMLDSMIYNPRPTRAEISDVTNAVLDQADAVMLSGETAAGRYPIETVMTMRDIIQHAEGVNIEHAPYIKKAADGRFTTLVKSASEMAREDNIKAIVLGSYSGYAARLVAHFRTNKPIYVGTNNSKTFTQLALVWGVTSYCSTEDEISEVFKHMVGRCLETDRLSTGDDVIAVFGRGYHATEQMRMVGVMTV